MQRPLAECIAALQQRSQQKATGWRPIPNADAERVQCWLWQEQEKVLAETPHVTVNYHELRRAPEEQIARIISYLGLSPTGEQMARALAHVRAAATFGE